MSWRNSVHTALVQWLANNTIFQQFVHHTSSHVDRIQEQGFDAIKHTVTSATQATRGHHHGDPSFIAHFFRELREGVTDVFGVGRSHKRR